jgi:aspartyl-tRNA(Asn)/glutamyl-tRNA(Gln) amidotransferase subunit B
VDGVIFSNPDEAERVRGGDEKVVGFLVGRVMKATRGNADGGRVRELLMSKLGS